MLCYIAFNSSLVLFEVQFNAIFAIAEDLRRQPSSLSSIIQCRHQFGKPREREISNLDFFAGEAELRVVMWSRVYESSCRG
jgi:hypothetical protein